MVSICPMLISVDKKEFGHIASVINFNIIIMCLVGEKLHLSCHLQNVCQALLASPLSADIPPSPTLTISSLHGCSSEREVIFPGPFSPRSRTFSPPSYSDCDDTASLASSSSATVVSKRKFSIPDSWPPSIMACLQQTTEEEQRRALTPPIRNEIVRVVATQMFCYDPKPQKDFCTLVAKKLVAKYPFMQDTGEKVSGYVSY